MVLITVVLIWPISSRKENLEYIPSDCSCDFPKHLFPELLKRGIQYFGFNIETGSRSVHIILIKVIITVDIRPVMIPEKNLVIIYLLISPKKSFLLIKSSEPPKRQLLPKTVFCGTTIPLSIKTLSPIIESDISILSPI